MADYTADLTGLMLLFALSGRLLSRPPEKEWIEQLLVEDVFHDAPVGGDQEDISRGLKLIQTWRDSAWKQDAGRAFAELDADYLRLFIGIGKVLAPPWESVHFSRERLVFQKQTLEVRNWYRNYGLEVEQINREPDDHIGLELTFLSHLAQLGLQAQEMQDAVELERSLGEMQAFLTGHPLRWAQGWCELVDQHAQTDFYRGVAFLANGALKVSAEMLEKAVGQEGCEVEIG